MSKITRRDFVNGILMAAGASLLPIGCRPGETLDPLYYPPGLTGLRGSHPGSNTHAHALGRDGKSDWGSIRDLPETYDLVVVGGGISGLAAAYLYRRTYGADKRVLILDNHDDFGGHAKRNEHTVGGELRISYGGSQSIVEPQYATEVVKEVFAEIGVSPERFETAYDRAFFRRHNLGAVTYFSRAKFGEDRIVRHPFCNYPNYVEGIIMGGKMSDEEAVRQTPLSARGKEQLLRVLKGGVHLLDVSEAELAAYTRSTSYFDYLRNTLGVDDPGVLRMARHSALDWASTGTDIMSIAGAKSSGALGFAPKEVYDEDNPYIYHFPDGNAGVARALVKAMVPEVAEGNTAEELVLARFDYGALDRPGNDVRIRLNSTVIKAEHAGAAGSADGVNVTYIREGQAYRVRGSHVVMACYNMVIPHIVPTLPEGQREALHQQDKSPLIYTSVGFRNWRAMKEMEIGLALCPGNMHQAVFMDFPVSMGGYEYTATPDEPCVIQMISCPYGTVGAPRHQQYREARVEMLSRTFADYEAEIREHLSGMLPAELFDFDRDVESITVNRWAHGYSVGGPGDSTRIGRQPFGRITIANSDSAPGADMKTAIDMAARAVGELG